MLYHKLAIHAVAVDFHLIPPILELYCVLTPQLCDSPIEKSRIEFETHRMNQLDRQNGRHRMLASRERS